MSEKIDKFCENLRVRLNAVDDRMNEVKASIKAADVLMGHDQDCASWIANCRPTLVAVEGGDAAAAGAGRGRRVNRRSVVAAV